MRRCVGNLFCLSMVVGRVSVKSNLADWYKGVVRVWPDFCDIENIEFILFCVFLWHGLDEPVPAGEVTFSNFIVKIVCAVLRIFDTLSCCFSSSEIFYTLASFVVILYIMNFTFGIYPSESVGGVPIYVTVAVWCATVAEQNSNLVQSFR